MSDQVAADRAGRRRLAPAEVQAAPEAQQRETREVRFLAARAATPDLQAEPAAAMLAMPGAVLGAAAVRAMEPREARGPAVVAQQAAG
ncbi:MAG: hypothetical protein ABI560_18150, partial [Myxococcales bacterium]